MTILVTGGTGNLGSLLVADLLNRHQSVRVLTRDAGRARERLGAIPEIIRGDASNPATLRRAVQGVDTVVSAMTGFGPGADGPKAVDYQGNLNLIAAAEGAQVRRFVLVSMHGASATHPMELMRMKHRAEQALCTSQLDWVIVRPNVFMELWLGIVGGRIVTQGRARVFGRGDNPINFNSANDVARFVQRAVFEPGLGRTAIDVGGPENLTFNQLVDRIQQAAGRKAAVQHVPMPMMKLSSLVLRPFKPDVAGMIEAGIAFDTADMSFDCSDLRRRFPDMQLTPLVDVLRARFAVSASRPAS